LTIELYDLAGAEDDGERMLDLHGGLARAALGYPVWA
jgi:hypothetical protein